MYKANISCVLYFPPVQTAQKKIGKQTKQNCEQIKTCLARQTQNASICRMRSVCRVLYTQYIDPAHFINQFPEKINASAILLL